MLRHTSVTSRNEESESQPLLSLLSQPHSNVDDSVLLSCHLPKHFCITSKAALLILFWTGLVGGLYTPVMGVVQYLALYMLSLVYVNVSLPYMVLYFFVALLYMFYPLSGFFADVFCGRLRTVTFSLCVVLCSLVVFLINYALICYMTLPSSWTYLLISVSSLSLFTLILGETGYGANFIQFGLDQLIEAPSQHQALFVHWAKWSYDLFSTVFVVVFTYYSCHLGSFPASFVLVLPLVLCTCLLVLLLPFSCWKHRWFYDQPGQRNPFKVVVKVLNFVRKHRYPLQRSAFTYCDDESPSRLDIAKERYGGPFTTEQVEDVKTFLRIVVILLTIGPAFIMEVPTSIVSLHFIGRHITSNELGQFCDQWKWILIDSGLLRCLVRTLFLPVYIWINFTLLQKRVPKILFRIGLGITIYMLGIVSIVAVDVAGHILYQQNDTQCIFNLQTLNDSSDSIPAITVPDLHSTLLFIVPNLTMHWSTLILPNIFLGIGPTLVTATTYEFISTQSPHSMKGLLLGTFFAITGGFEFFGSIALTPFTSQMIWTNEHAPVISCLASYLIIICVVALIGLVLFSIVAKNYKYRERDDRPYDQRFVVDFYSRYI